MRELCSEAFWIPSTGRESLGYCVEHPELAAWPCPWDDIRTERDDLRAKVAAVEALAERYEADARSEGYGGEPWSTTGAAIRAALEADQ